MIKWSRFGVVLGLLGLCDCVTALSNAQTIERNTKITGPRGRSIDRQVDIERGPGTFSRQVQVQRPGGTIDRSTTIQRGWGGFPGGGFGGFRPLPFFPGPRPVTSFGLGITAAPMITIPFFGGGAAFGGGGGGGMGGPGMGMAGGEAWGQAAFPAASPLRPARRIRSTRWCSLPRSCKASITRAGVTERASWASLETREAFRRSFTP